MCCARGYTNISAVILLFATAFSRKINAVGLNVVSLICHTLHTPDCDCLANGLHVAHFRPKYSAIEFLCAVVDITGLWPFATGGLVGYSW